MKKKPIKITRERMTSLENFSSIFENSNILYKSKITINDSTSKAMYSFPLSQRFQKRETDYSSFYYNIPSTLTQRKTSIGYGNRSTILLSLRGKTDNYYNIPPDINPKSGSPKYSFGFSRDTCRKPKCLDESKTPGPSYYFPYKKFGQNGLKYSMSFRYKYKKAPDNFPGPGAYEIPSFINKNGTKFSKTKRFNLYNWNYPGPGAYDTENTMKGNGIIYNSRFLSNNAKTFGKKLKWIKDKLVTPGPGAYEIFSDFEGLDKHNYITLRKNDIFRKKRIKSSYSSRPTSALTRRTWG